MLRLVTLVLLTLLAAPVVAAPVPKSLKTKPPARAKIEPRPGEKLFSVEFDDVPLKKVVELLEKEADLLCRTEKLPDLRVTLRTIEKVCVSELFAQLNDELRPLGYILARMTVSFNVLKVDTPLDRKCCPTVTPEEMDRRTPDEPVQMILPAFDQGGVDLGLKQAESITHKWFEVKPLGDDKLIVVGRAADVRQFLGKFSTDIEQRIKADRETPLQLLERLRRGR
jgi:hypothetical protein